MVGAVSSASYSGFDFAAYAASRARHASPREIDDITAARKAANPQTAVQPVNALGKVTADTPSEPPAQSAALSIREGADPAEMAVRMRIQYVDDPAAAEQAIPGLPGQKEEGVVPGLPGQKEENAIPGFPGQEEENVPGLPGQKEEDDIPGLPGQEEDEDDVKSAQETMEESKCETCAERKYQDGSNDPGVSFKTPAHIDPAISAAMVRAHEMEHVTRNQAKADREGREVVSQSVTYSTAVCPECGTPYISGGTTRTVTSGAQAQQPAWQQRARSPFSVVA